MFSNYARVFCVSLAAFSFIYLPVYGLSTTALQRNPMIANDLMLLAQSPDSNALNKDPYLLITPTANGSLQAQLTLENETTVSQYINVQPSMQRLGRFRKGDTLSKKLAPGTAEVFMLPINDLPRRKWPGKITVTITSTPSIDELPVDAVEQWFGKLQEMTYTTHIFLIPYEFAGVLISIFLIALLRPRKKTVSQDLTSWKHHPKKRHARSSNVRTPKPKHT